MLPIQIKTEFGLKQFDKLHAKRSETKNIELFKARCKNDYDLVGVYFKYMLEDEEMTKKYRLDDDDLTGWRMFRELSDVSSVLRYFAGNYA